LVRYISKPTFYTIFGSFMILFAFLIVVKSRLGDKSAAFDKTGNFRARRRLTDINNVETAFSFNMGAGICISILVGFISGLLGIGGGIVHVPALVFLGFPVHFAIATSLFVLCISSFISLLVHLTEGSLANVSAMAIYIGVGAIIGAQFGARLSKKFKGSILMIILAAALVIAGIRILILGISQLT